MKSDESQNDTDSEEEPIQKFSFQIKLFLLKKICCSNRLSKWLMFLDEEFKENTKSYDENLEKLASRLNLTNILQTDAVIQDEFILTNKEDDNSSQITRKSIKDALIHS